MNQQTSTPHRPAPLLVWSALGMLFLIVQTWVLARWTADGNLRIAADTGVSVSATRAVALRMTEIAFVLVTIGIVWWALRKAIRRRVLTFDLAALVCAALLSWQDPLLDTSALHNHYLVHTTSWGGYIPLFGHHTGVEIQPLYTRFGYIAGMMTVFVPCWLTDRVLRKRPAWGPARGYLLAAAFGTLTIGLLEVFAIHTVGMYSWAGLREELCVLPGTWYQYSPLEAISSGFLFCGPLALARRTALTGHTPHPFSGLPTLTGRRRTLLSLLAMNGLQNTLLLLWMLTLIAMSGDRGWPSELPDWFGTNGTTAR